ncbi:MAG: manganese efflux pump MntP family protein [Synergistaceae bacterium]|jgi:putative Mn2+ efflux pump MntP|nr:manganese efflux pump MntP family protein [Synergistaceae bacterium]
MNYYVDSLLSAASLAMDALAVSLCVGARGGAGTCGTALRMGAACGAFQFFMPLGGWVLGAYALSLIDSIDHWVAFGLLAFVGCRMIRGSFEENVCPAGDPTKSAAIFYLALATSVDAMAVGASFALTDRHVFPLAVSAGVITAGLCVAGVIFGSRAGAKLGNRAELLGGAVLIMIGLNILRGHIFLG